MNLVFPLTPSGITLTEATDFRPDPTQQTSWVKPIIFPEVVVDARRNRNKAPSNLVPASGVTASSDSTWTSKSLTATKCTTNSQVANPQASSIPALPFPYPALLPQKTYLCEVDVLNKLGSTVTFVLTVNLSDGTSQQASVSVPNNGHANLALNFVAPFPSKIAIGTSTYKASTCTVTLVAQTVAPAGVSFSYDGFGIYELPILGKHLPGDTARDYTRYFSEPIQLYAWMPVTGALITNPSMVAVPDTPRRAPTIQVSPDPAYYGWEDAYPQPAAILPTRNSTMSAGAVAMFYVRAVADEITLSDTFDIACRINSHPS